MPTPDPTVVQQFARLHERLDEIVEKIHEIKLTCAEHTLRYEQISTLLDGNGHPALDVRLDRLEQVIPAKKERGAFWMALSALLASFALVVVDGLALWLRK